MPRHRHCAFYGVACKVMTVLDGMIAAGPECFLRPHKWPEASRRRRYYWSSPMRIYKGTGDPPHVVADLARPVIWENSSCRILTTSPQTPFAISLISARRFAERVEASGGQIRLYRPIGYHGSAILIDGSYRWQTYTNYTQGYAKMRLEGIAEKPGRKASRQLSITVPKSGPIRPMCSRVSNALIPLLLA